MQAIRIFVLKGRYPSQRAGFSLLELSIVVVILSIVMMFGLEVAMQLIGRGAYSETQEKLAQIDKTITKFYRVYGRLPCPAKRGLPITNSHYGVEDCTVTLAGTAPAVLGGTVPVQTLGLQTNMALDSFGDKINYFVTQALTSAPTFAGNPSAIEVRSGRLEQPCATTACTVLATDAAYVLLSNGFDKRGAVNKLGLTPVACAVAGDLRIDSQNCLAASGGGVVLGVVIPANVFYDSRYNTGVQPINYDDDAILWHSKGQLW